MSDRLISIILPVYNQADHIGKIVGEHQAALARLEYPHEMLLVVNACRDGSLAVCRALAEEHPAVRVLESEQGGWGRAVKLGLREARGELLCYSNSARTATEDLTLLLLYAVVYPDVVVKANRKIRESWVRRLGSVIYNLECRALFNLPNWDLNGTPKIFPRKFSRLLELERDDDLIDVEFHVACRDAGYPMVEVPILSTRRHGGRSTTNLRRGLRMYWRVWRLRRAWRGDAW